MIDPLPDTSAGSRPRPRLRFAPSPTGFLHVGGARAALFNWLVARGTGGTFILRIEDTDQERSRPELIDAILEPLRWLGLDWDEGPYYQSQRVELYTAAINTLLATGNAYFCDCTREQVDARAKQRGGRPGYDRHCRNRGVTDGVGAVVRFRVPDVGLTVVEDVIRGRVEFANDDLEDFVVRRSDGSPVFLVANAVDDAAMGITHAVRGEDLLNTTPKVILLWRALAYEAAPPIYAHLPLLVNEARKKLSKRRDDVALGDYIDRGYLPAAMRNYLATLGWGPPDGVEIRPIEEIVALFRLEDVNKAPAFFDVKKLDHVNGEYIRKLSVETFVDLARPWLVDRAPWPPERYRPEVFAALAGLVQERVKTLGEITDQVDWLFLADPPDDDEAFTKVLVAGGETVIAILEQVGDAFASCTWGAGTLESEVRHIGDAIKAKSQVPVRVAVTGRRVGLPLFEPLVLLGRDEARRRLRRAVVRLTGSD